MLPNQGTAKFQALDDETGTLQLIFRSDWSVGHLPTFGVLKRNDSLCFPPSAVINNRSVHDVLYFAEHPDMFS